MGHLAWSNEDPSSGSSARARCRAVSSSPRVEVSSPCGSIERDLPATAAPLSNNSRPNTPPSLTPKPLPPRSRSAVSFEPPQQFSQEAAEPPTPVSRAAAAKGNRPPFPGHRGAGHDHAVAEAPLATYGGGQTPSRQKAARGKVPLATSPPFSPSPSTPGSAASRAGSVPSPKISAMRYDSMHVAPAFSTGRSRFATEYSRGALPCRIDHGTCSLRISWDIPTEELFHRRDALIALCAEGLREMRHPYSTVARLAFADLACLEGCQPLAEEALHRVVSGVRLALLAEVPTGAAKVGSSSAATSIFETALRAVGQVARAEGPRLVPHLHLILPPIGKRMFGKTHKELIQETLREIECNCGPEATKAMRARGVTAGLS